MSRHLRVLRGAGVVDQELAEGDGRARVIRLRPAPFEQLRGWIEEIEAFWGDQLASFKAHAERVYAARLRESGSPSGEAPERDPEGESQR